MTWIITYTGRRFPLAAPTAEDVDPRDVVWALAHLCRWGGHTKRFFSVAQHSVLVSRLAGEIAREERTDELHHARWGLLHDAAEAYIGDVVSPLKRLITGYAEIEAGVLRAIARRFGLVGVIVPQVVHRADMIARALEAEALVNGGGHAHAFVEPALADEGRRLLGEIGARDALAEMEPRIARWAFYNRAVGIGMGEAWA